MQSDLYFSVEQVEIYLYLNHELKELEKLNIDTTLEGYIRSFADSAFTPHIFSITLQKSGQRNDFVLEPEDEEKRWATNYRVKIGQYYIDELLKKDEELNKRGYDNFDPNLNSGDRTFCISTRFGFGDKIDIFPKDKYILQEKQKNKIIQKTTLII